MTGVKNLFDRTVSPWIGAERKVAAVLKWITRSGALVLVVGLAAGCRRGQPAAPTAAPPPAKVTAAKPVLQEVTDYQEYTGYLEAVETVTIRTRVRGFLQRVA